MFEMKNSIDYFEESCNKNTFETLTIARKRALELGIRQILVASSHGYTAKEAVSAFAGTCI